MNGVEQFKSYYKEVKSNIDKKLEEYNKNFIKEKNKILKENLEYFKELNSNGKNIRGTLVNLGYYLKKDNKEYASDLSLAYEVFQTAILVHDDVIDKDPKRRGKTTIHEANLNKYKKYKKQDDINHLSNSIGICMGDYGLYSANKIIINAYKNDKNLIDVYNYFNDTVLNTIRGELLDVILPIESKNNKLTKETLEETIFNIYKLKTAYYTIIGPLTTGLLLAGTNEKEIKDIEEFGEKVGIAFQIQDDILGIFSSSMEKELDSDIKEYKQTILYSYIIGTKYRNEFLKYYGKSLTKQEIEKVKELLIISGAKKYGETIMNNMYDEGIKILNNINWIKEDKKELLVGFVNYLKTRNK